MDKITHSVLARKKRETPELTEEEKKFCDLLLEGYTNINAMFESGIADRDRRDDKKYRAKMTAKAKNLNNTRRIRDYMYRNRRCAVVFTPTDMEKVATHMMDICMGNASQEVETVVNGKVDTISVKPSFKDQIAAAGFLMKYTEMLKNDKRLDIGMARKAEQADKDAIEFVKRYSNFRPIEDGVFTNANGSEKEMRKDLDAMED